MAAFYLWLRRHPRLVDGVLAAALGIPALVSAVAARRYALVAVSLALVIPLVFRRDHPVAAFAIGITVGALQVLLNIHVNTIDVAIVVLLYTLAAYCQRRVSVAGLAALPHRVGRRGSPVGTRGPRPGPLDRAGPGGVRRLVADRLGAR